MEKLGTTVKIPIIRSIVAIILGLVLIFWPAMFMGYTIWILGIAMLLAGIFPLIGAITKKQTVSYVSIIYLIIGVLLLVSPAFFINIIMYILGILIIIGAFEQFLMLNQIKKSGMIVAWYSYIFPVILLVSGLIMLIKPGTSMTVVFFYFGILCLIYGVSSLVSSQIYKK